MPLDVPVPDPPPLHGPQPHGEYDAVDEPEESEEVGDDYRRGEIADILADGAWHDGFEEWTTHTGLTVAEFAVVDRHDLTAGLDFYWDLATDEVGYQTPSLPDAVRAEISADDAEEIASELDALGRVVSETLENDYLPREDVTFGFFDDEADEEQFDYEER